MELVTIECDITVDQFKPPKNPMKSSISINLRRFRQIVCKKPNGHETIKEHRLVSPTRKFNSKISSYRNVDSVLHKSKLISNTWVRKRVSALISRKASAFMRAGRVYMVKADVDVIFENRCNLEYENESLVVKTKKKNKKKKKKKKTKKPKKKEEKVCAICLGELNDEVGYTEIQCSHVYHRDCIWKWLRKKMTCPTCRRCVCGQQFCNCTPSD